MVYFIKGANWMSKHWSPRSSGQDIRHVFPPIHLQMGRNEVTSEKLEHGSWVSAETFPPPLVMNIHNESQEGITQNCAHMEDKDSILFHLHTLRQFFILMIVLQWSGDFQRWKPFFFFFFYFFSLHHLAASFSMCKISLLSGSTDTWQVKIWEAHLNLGALRNFQKLLTSCEHTSDKTNSLLQHNLVIVTCGYVHKVSQMDYLILFCLSKCLLCSSILLLALNQQIIAWNQYEIMIMGCL